MMSSTGGDIIPQEQQQQGAAPPSEQSAQLTTDEQTQATYQTPVKIVPSPTIPPPAKPRNPIMDTYEETYIGSNSFYFVFGRKPKVDWSGIEDLSSRSMSDLCFRSLDPVIGQKTKYYRAKALSSKFEGKNSITDLQADVWDHLVNYRLDTNCYLLDPRNPKVKVLCVVTKHTQLTSGMKMVETLTAYTYLKFDMLNKKNCSEEKTFLLTSLYETVKQGFKPFHNKEKDTSTVIWSKFIQYLLNSTSRTFDKFKDDIRKLRPRQYSGQNIEEMSPDYIEKCEEMTNTGYYDISLVLNMIDGFLCATQDARETFHHNMNDHKSKVEKLQEITVLLSKQVQMDKYTRERLSFKDVYSDVVTNCKALCDDNTREPSKFPKDRGRPVDHSEHINMINMVHRLIASIPNNFSTKNNDIGSGACSGKKGKGGKHCQNCDSKDHPSSNCTEPRNTAKERKAISHELLPSWQLTTPESGESYDNEADRNTHCWCDKCENWTSTYSSQDHASSSKSSSQTTNNKKKNKMKASFSPETKLTSIDLQIWHQVEEYRKETTPFTFLIFLQYCYFVTAQEVCLGLPMPSYAAVIELLSQQENFWINKKLLPLSSLKMIWEMMKLLKYIMGPLRWISPGYLTSEILVWFKPTFDPMLIAPEINTKRRQCCSSSQERHKTRLKSARDYNLTPKH